jgi:hypothetical protein
MTYSEPGNAFILLVPIFLKDINAITALITIIQLYLPYLRLTVQRLRVISHFLHTELKAPAAGLPPT